MTSDELFLQISIVMALGAAFALFMKLIKQPLIVGHILTGFIAGPAVLNIVKSNQGFGYLSTLGVALLLFIVGLELKFGIIVRLSRVVFITTAVQMTTITAAGGLVAYQLGFGRLESIIIGICLSLSSTVIIVTLLQQKKELMRLFAQIAVGILIIQDLVTTGAKIALSAKSAGETPFQVGLLAGKGLFVVALLYVAGRYILPRISKTLESSKELMLTFTLGWALGIAALFYKIGFSIEVGALLAGMALANTPFTHEASSRLRPIRDFFIIIFLITLGYSLAAGQIIASLPAALLFSAIAIVLKPLVILITLGALGYTKRASFKAAIALGQISEFSLVFVVAAASHSYVSQNVQSIIGLTAVISFTISAYLIHYSDYLYEVLEHKLRFFERKMTKFDTDSISFPTNNIVIFGYRKGGAEFIRTFKRMNKKFIVVDYDPEAIELIEKHKVSYLYGDATDAELIEELKLDKSKLIISTISDFAANEFLAHWLKEHNPSAVFVGSADNAHHAAKLYAEGTAYVMMPHFIGSEKISSFIQRTGFKKSEFNKYREKHLLYLATHYSEESS